MIEYNIINKLQHGKVMMWIHEESDNTQKTREMLNKHGIIFEEQTVNDDIQMSLVMHTGYSSFPNIYYGEDHIGGHDDVKVLLETPQIKEA